MQKKSQKSEISGKILQKLAKKVDFRKILDPIWDLVLKKVSKFVIPEFRDTPLIPKITKCGDLLYKFLRRQKFINPLGHKTILRPLAEGWFCVLR